jgi:hypothetical protein
LVVAMARTAACLMFGMDDFSQRGRGRGEIPFDTSLLW